ncbi:MAG: ATP-binding protein, partial [Oscillospiraceae bacterium]|nr:ATP-binding protein [Oscillospiraceae bacterium]
MMKKILPIGIDNFRKIRETDRYYIDKTLFIRDFIEAGDEVSLITRPRRFGKTLNMTMLREFFDITKDSRAIFDGLEIMDTEYASQINSRPVIFFTFKDCKAYSIESLIFKLSTVVLTEYNKYKQLFKSGIDESNVSYITFNMIFEMLLNRNIDLDFLEIAILTLEQTVYEHYKIKPILLIDEYDQPIMSSFEYGYHDRMGLFFSGFYGAALKGQDCLHLALLTGIQRIAKESIFSQLNNIKVYTVIDKQYSDYFGLTIAETKELLSDYGLDLDESVKQKYDGYLFGNTEIYNPWSLLYYAETGELKNYWINTSTNALIRKSIAEANHLFHKGFDMLIEDGIAKISADLECSFIELNHYDTLWGLLINTGYITVLEQINELFMIVRIPNGEVRSEFMRIIASQANVQSLDLHRMFQYLLEGEMDGFVEVYRELVISCTSYFDAKENAYHMLFQGMCISLNNLYKIKSNIESGVGRSDIVMESLSADRPHIIIEFKQGEAV